MIPSLRVLLVEDNPTDAKLVLHALRSVARAIEHARVDELATMRSALGAGGWDMVISDWSMPRFSALGALQALKESGQDLPFLIVSGTIGEEAAVDAMRSGAHDYVLKDNLARLGPAVERELREREVREARRRAEEALRVAEARFRRLWDSGIVAMTVSDREGRLVDVNGAGLGMLGYARDELLSGAVFRSGLTPPEWHASDQAAQRELDATGVSAPREKELFRKDGSRAAVLTVAARLDGGETIAIAVDVTERKRVEDALFASETRFARLGDCGIVGIVSRDLDGGVYDANDTYLRMLGYAREDLVSAGRAAWTALTPPEWQAQDRAVVTLLRTKGIAPPFEKELLRKDGSRVPVLVGAAMMDASRCIAFVADLTERKRAEAALRQTEEQLRQAQKMEAVGRLAGGVAHDFNNVLTVILSQAEFLLEDLAPDDPKRADVADIRAAGSRAAALTRQLLLFSRQQVMEARAIDLNALLTNMDKMLRRLVGEDVDLVSSATAAIGVVRADPGAIEQVVMNLVVNARDAMPTGGKLTIETTNVTLDAEYARTHVGVNPGPHVMLAVSDTGVGMDRATQARVFEPFFTTKPPGQGTGLGLSTVFGIVHQCGGSIWVYSELGHGTTFKVFLPRVDEEAESAPATEAPTTLRGTETVLLVEDEEAVRAIARGILTRSGYRVLEAGNAGEALLFCERHAETIHLLLSDVVMPRMSGPELAKRLASVRPEMRVLCMSGYTDDSIVRHGVLDARFAFIQKPLTPESLTRKVREVLDRPPVEEGGRR